MDLEIINKLYLELSQITTARNARETEMQARLDWYEKNTPYVNLPDLSKMGIQKVNDFAKAVVVDYDGRSDEEAV